MNFDKYMKELRTNASEGKFEDNEILYDRITCRMRRLNEKYETFKKSYKLSKPRVCEGPCGETKHKKYFTRTGVDYYTCDDCMKLRKKKRRQQKVKDKVEEQIGTYTKEECTTLYQELQNVHYERYMSDLELNRFVIKLCEDYELSEVKTEKKTSDITFCFDDVSGFRDTLFKNFKGYEPTVYDDVVYNKTGTVLTLIIEKLKKCRKRTQEEKDDI